ncbi:ABC transporter ATP-binding protein [Pseudogemmobacter humi]|uniref:Spermidine/putrescine import ATP-binding protein PotA n=1 Tax=Pseudogemmobacter humi TaxID=2483812 RepID=A0A3P5X2Z7_9RHOB|nr:ABC transporter ATP-binding protein [Pseudogemmobacter humi]VDC24906.1 Spermidine/putrescine import ATP-binding protein PotA [Pseudogemmobacter humi]
MAAGTGSGPGGISIRALVKHYGTFEAVAGIDLEIRRGEFLTLLGPSGSGKTTLLMMIAGFQDATSGDIRLDDRSIVAMPPEKRNFGMVFQGYALFPHMTVADNIGYALSVRGRPRAEIAARVAEMLELAQLQGMGARLPAQLSGGQQQRVALARALAFSPPVLLLDEPLGALDRKLRIEVQEQLKELHRRLGTTFIYVTHDQEEALSMSDRIVIMRAGRVEQVGTPEELYSRPRTEFAASFLGKSNFLRRDGKVWALRPEKIDLSVATGQATGGRLSGRILSMAYFGSVLKYQVETAEQGQIEVDVDAWRGGGALPVGTAVGLDWSEQAAVLLGS